jgi:hypothetical protein
VRAALSAVLGANCEVLSRLAHGLSSLPGGLAKVFVGWPPSAEGEARGRHRELDHRSRQSFPMPHKWQKSKNLQNTYVTPMQMLKMIFAGGWRRATAETGRKGGVHGKRF